MTEMRCLVILQVVQNSFAFLVQNPLIYRDPIHVFKHTAECGGGISAEVGKLLHILHFVVVLHDEILEAFRISADGVEECTDWCSG